MALKAKILLSQLFADSTTMHFVKKNVRKKIETLNTKYQVATNKHKGYKTF